MPLYLVHINIIGPETGRELTFTGREEFGEELKDRIFLRRVTPPREEFILTICDGGSHPISSGEGVVGEVIASPVTSDPEKIKRLIDFLREKDWREEEGHASFQEDEINTEPPP